MIWEIHLGIFDTFTKVRMCGQHPGRMSMVGVGGHFYVFSFLHVSEHSEHICFVFLLFLVEETNFFHGWGVPHPFAEYSTKIINLIFEPFP